MNEKKIRASITVEASFCLPIFFLTLFSLFYEFNVLFGVNKNHIRLSDAAKNYAVYGTKADTIVSVFDAENIVMWSENGGYKVCCINYKKNVPFGVKAVINHRIYQQIVVNSFEGKSMCSDENLSEEDVYITETGRVYHTHSDCTYLKPSVVRVMTKNIESMRNLSGAKYKKCEYCFRKESVPKTYVYITDYGDRYHLSKQCSGIKRNVKKVNKSETGGMPECNKCKERG